MLTDVVAAAEEAATKESESRAAERVGKLSVAERALVAAQDDAAKAVADRTIAVDALAVLEIEMAAERRKVNDVASEVEAVAAALERAQEELARDRRRHEAAAEEASAELQRSRASHTAQQVAADEAIARTEQLRREERRRADSLTIELEHATTSLESGRRKLTQLQHVSDAEMTRIRAELTLERERADEAEAAVDRAKEQAATDRKQLAGVGEELAAAQAEMVLVHKQLDAAASTTATDLRRSKAEVTRLSRELVDAHQRTTSAEEQARAASETGATLAEQLRESAALQANEIATIGDKLLDSEKACATKDAEIAAAKSMSSESRNSLLLTQSKLLSAQATQERSHVREVGDMKKEATDLKTRLATMAEEKEKQVKAGATAAADATESSRQLRASKEQRDDAERALQRLRTQCDDLRTECDQLKAKLQIAVSATKEYAETIAELQSTLDNAVLQHTESVNTANIAAEKAAAAAAATSAQQSESVAEQQKLFESLRATEDKLLARFRATETKLQVEIDRLTVEATAAADVLALTEAKLISAEDPARQQQLVDAAQAATDELAEMRTAAAVAKVKQGEAELKARDSLVQCTDVQSQLVEVTAELASVKNELWDLDSAAKSDLTSHADELIAGQRVLEAARRDASTLSEQIESERTTIVALRARITSLEDDVTGIKAGKAAADKAAAAARTDVAKLEEAAATLSAGLSPVGTLLGFWPSVALYARGCGWVPFC
jgi:chromosome segregation ATPase